MILFYGLVGARHCWGSNKGSGEFSLFTVRDLRSSCATVGLLVSSVALLVHYFYVAWLWPTVSIKRTLLSTSCVFPGYQTLHYVSLQRGSDRENIQGYRRLQKEYFP